MEEERKVYIGNLSYNVTEQELKQAIENRGISVKEVKIITDKFSGRSKGFGFAEFDTEEQTQQAIAALNGQTLNGRTLRVSRAHKMRVRRDNFSSGYKRRTSHLGR